MSDQTVENEMSQQPRPRSPMRWLWISLVVVLLLPLVAYGGFVLYVMYGVEFPDDAVNGFTAKSRQNVSKRDKTELAKPKAAKSGVAKTAAETIDDTQRKNIVGTWERFDDGRRRLTINGDGSAELVYEPKGFKMKAALLFADKLTVQIEWTLKEGFVEFRSKSGKPENAFKVAKLAEGERKRRRIVELTKERLTLTDNVDGRTDEMKDRVSYWKRIK